MERINKDHVGSSLDSYLEEEGILDTINANIALKSLAVEFSKIMSITGITITELAKQMNTSRAQVYRLLRPKKMGAFHW
jgi:antitoxin HicB